MERNGSNCYVVPSELRNMQITIRRSAGEFCGGSHKSRNANEMSQSIAESMI